MFGMKVTLIVVVGFLGVLWVGATPTPSAFNDYKQSVTSGTQPKEIPSQQPLQNVTSNSRNDSNCPLGWKAPWQVGLLLSTPNGTSTERMCGGVLIHKHWVLTAASCVENTTKKVALIGSTEYLDGFFGKQGQVIEVSETIIHGRYRHHQPPQHDIALLRLSADAVLGTKAKIAQIPHRNSSLYKDGTPMVIAGWGRTSTKPVNDESLHCSRVLLVSRKECEQVYEPLDMKIRSSHLCTSGVGACNGDGGGGLVHVGTDGRNTVIGIISWSLSCGDHYTVYTNVEKHRPWVLRNLED